MEVINRFLCELDKIGAKGCFFSATHLKELEDEANRIKENLLYGKKVYERYLEHYYDFSSLYQNQEIKSLCIVATPSPQCTVRFEYEDSFLDVEVPPVYIDRKEILNDIISITAHLFPRYGYQSYPIILPKKSIAVHSGLAKYGRNNLVYVEGMGSYHRLTAFASNIPYEDEQWYTFQYLDSCESCRACEKSCPTKAISPEHFRIDTDKCLAFYNEQPDPIPDWIDLSWHNCLVGCLKCQKVCPHNKPFLGSKVITEIFRKEETKLILNQVPFEELPMYLQDKLSRLCLDIYYDKLSRNLSVLNRTNFIL